MVALTKDRRLTAIVVTVCGMTTAVGGLLTWASGHGARPTMGMTHTSFSKMLVYTLQTGAPFVKTVGFVVLALGILMVIGGLLGLRIIAVIGAVLALGVAGMWIGLVTHHYNTPHLPNSYYLNPMHLPWSALREGAWLTICGAVLGLVSTVALRGWKPVVGRSSRTSDQPSDQGLTPRA
jgi:hypothetical protein